MIDLLKNLNPFRKKEVAVAEDTKFKLTKANAKPIAKAWGLGAALSVLAFTGTFAMTSIDWGALAAAVTLIVPPIFSKATAWLEARKAEVKPAE